MEVTSFPGPAGPSRPRRMLPSEDQELGDRIISMQRKQAVAGPSSRYVQLSQMIMESNRAGLADLPRLLSTNTAAVLGHRAPNCSIRKSTTPIHSLNHHGLRLLLVRLRTRTEANEFILLGLHATKPQDRLIITEVLRQMYIVRCLIQVSRSLHRM